MKLSELTAECNPEAELMIWSSAALDYVPLDWAHIEAVSGMEVRIDPCGVLHLIEVCRDLVKHYEDAGMCGCGNACEDQFSEEERKLVAKARAVLKTVEPS